MYNNVVERCFRDCVESFRRKDLDNNEERVSGATQQDKLQLCHGCHLVNK